MRKLLFPLLAAGSFALALGCHHIAGDCDCEGPRDHCRFNYLSIPPNTDPITVAPAKAPEALKEAPKDAPKDKI